MFRGKALQRAKFQKSTTLIRHDQNFIWNISEQSNVAKSHRSERSLATNKLSRRSNKSSAIDYDQLKLCEDIYQVHMFLSISGFLTSYMSVYFGILIILLVSFQEFCLAVMATELIETHWYY